MKISKGFILRAIKGANGEESNVVITVGEASKKLNGMITLNPTCAFIWQVLQNGATREELIDAMIKEYDVSAEEVSNDVDNVINQFKQLGVIDD